VSHEAPNLITQRSVVQIHPPQPKSCHRSISYGRPTACRFALLGPFGSKTRGADCFSLFSVALSCVFKVIDGFGRLHKTLEIRERRLERVLKPWADQISCCPHLGDLDM
jgi:hypothetical protein